MQQESNIRKCDIFDRSMRIPGWKQEIIQEEVYYYQSGLSLTKKIKYMFICVFIKTLIQIPLCLGLGGLGSFVTQALCRLGVKKIISVDYDKVDIHNLNRQVNYSLLDVGTLKVESSVKNLVHHNISNTIIEGHNFDVVKNWDKIIKFVEECTVVFCMIDTGDFMDFSLQSLCLKLGRPLVLGGTFSYSLNVDYFGPTGSPCLLCSNDWNKEDIEKITPDKILSYQDLSFFKKNVNPIGQSNYFLCSICANFMVNIYVNKLFDVEESRKINRILFYTSTFETVRFDPIIEEKCRFCAHLRPPKEEQIIKEEVKSNAPQTESIENPKEAGQSIECEKKVVDEISDLKVEISQAIKVEEK